MDLLIPKEIVNFFTMENFTNYPFVKIPQQFADSRGVISNIADGTIGDVAVITSVQNSIRANHFHIQDWHLSYMVLGDMEYSWKKSVEEPWQTIEVVSGEMIFTPPSVLHKMEFKSDSVFIAISALSRKSQNYEADTIRI